MEKGIISLNMYRRHPNKQYAPCGYDRLVFAEEIRKQISFFVRLD